MSPGNRLIERMSSAFRASDAKKALAGLVFVVALSLLLELLTVKADLYSYTPPYQGSYESGRQKKTSEGWWFPEVYVESEGRAYMKSYGYAQLGDVAIWIDTYNPAKGPPFYAYAGFYVDVDAPSDIAQLKVKANIRSIRLRIWGEVTFYLQVGVDQPPTESSDYQVAFFSVSDYKYSDYGGHSWTPEVTTPITPGNHRIYFGVLAWTGNTYTDINTKDVWLPPPHIRIESVTITFVKKTSLTVNVDPQIASPNAPVTIYGRLTTLSGQGLAGQRVYFSYYSSLCHHIGNTTTEKFGVYNYGWIAPSKPGTYIVKVEFEGTEDLLHSENNTMLVVNQTTPQDFKVRVEPPKSSCNPRDTVNATIYVEENPIWPYTVQLTATGPSECSISQPSRTPNFSATLTIIAPSTPSTYTYKVIATSQGVTRNATFTLKVQQEPSLPPPPKYNFKINVPEEVPVEAGKTAYVTVEVKPYPQYPYTIRLNTNNGTVSPSSGVPSFTATWTITAPSTPGAYICTIIGRGEDGKINNATLKLMVTPTSLSSTDYYQGYVVVVNHYYIVDDVKAEARFTSPVDWCLDLKGPHNIDKMKKGDKDTWSAPNKLAFGDFFTIDVYAKLREYTTTTTQTVNKYYYNGRWNDNLPQNGAFEGYMKYGTKDWHSKILISVNGSLPKEYFWTMDESDPFNKSKYANGGTLSMYKSGLSGSDWVYIGSIGTFRVKSPKEAGVGEGSYKNVNVTLIVSWGNGKDSGVTTKTVSMRLSWIIPELRQVWSSPSSCVIRVYGVWYDDNSTVNGRPYFYYGLDIENRRLCLRTGMTKSGDTYAESDPIDPQSLRPTGYVVNRAFMIPVTPAVNDFGLMKSSVEYRELAIAVYERSNTGFRLRVYEFHEPYNPITSARVTLFIKDLSNSMVREFPTDSQGRAVDFQGFVSFARSELRLLSSYEVWALAWGTENVNVLYGRSPFGYIPLERVLELSQ
jgi:hypothetical protein